MKQGIEPLATFCNRPVPDWKMPYINDGDNFNAFITVIKDHRLTILRYFRNNFRKIKGLAKALGFSSSLQPFKARLYGPLLVAWYLCIRSFRQLQLLYIHSHCTVCPVENSDRFCSQTWRRKVKI